MKKLNSGGKTMKVTFCKTKAGNGFKIAVDKTWLYVSKEKLLAVVDGEASSCQFSEIAQGSSSDGEAPEDSCNSGSSHFDFCPSLIQKWE